MNKLSLLLCLLLTACVSVPIHPTAPDAGTQQRTVQEVSEHNAGEYIKQGAREMAGSAIWCAVFSLC